MKKILLLFIAVFFLNGCAKKTEVVTSDTIVATPQQDVKTEPTEFTASFEIYTRGTKRIFTDTMYHNQSDTVFIESEDPHLIQVKKSGLTWNDFFLTLPFSLTKECLVTGTKQTFCTSETETLRFWLNDVETSDALDLIIKPNDLLKIEYGK